MKKSLLTTLLPLFLVCLSWCISAEPAAGEDTSARPFLTLDQAIRTGLEKNPRMAISIYLRDASAARITQAQSGLYPRIDFNESFVRTNNPAQAFSLKLNQERITQQDFDPSRLNHPSPLNNFASVFSLSMPVYEAGQIRIGVKQARLFHESAILSEGRVRQEVITGVVAAFIAVLQTQDQLEVVRQSLETARANEKIVRKRYENGLTVKSDLLRAGVRISQLEQEHVSAASLVDVAMAALNAAMGIETDVSYRLVPFEENGSAPPAALEQWLEKARKNRPDLNEMRLRETAAEQEVKKAKMAHLPGVYLTGNYEIDSEDYTQAGDNYTVGVMLRLNLFGGFGFQAKIHEAVAAYQQVKAGLRQLELSVGVETKRAFFQARSAFERIRVSEAALQQAEEALRIVRNRYESGLFTIVNLLDAEVSLQQARANYLFSGYDHKLATAELHLAAGTSEEAFQNSKQ